MYVAQTSGLSRVHHPVSGLCLMEPLKSLMHCQATAMWKRQQIVVRGILKVCLFSGKKKSEYCVLGKFAFAYTIIFYLLQLGCMLHLAGHRFRLMCIVEIGGLGRVCYRIT